MKIVDVRIRNLRSVENAQLHLGAITLLVGKNNTGKSTIIRALHGIQATGTILPGDQRIGGGDISIEYELADFGSNPWGRPPAPAGSLVTAALVAHPPQQNLTQIHLRYTAGNMDQVSVVPSTEPMNFIYPYLSARKVIAFEEQIDRQRSLEVRPNLSNLVAKVDRLMDRNHPANSDFIALVEEVINLPLSAISSPSGKQVGMWVDRTQWIPIHQMGDGVSQMLGLITQLCMAENKLFLIEELENDIHPQGLKALLRVIEERSSINQFVLSTHNNIVVSHLGARADTTIYEVEGSIVLQNGRDLPLTTMRRVDNDVHARTELLASLGYELSDFDLFDGWLILEESSAERLIRNYLIPWFAPALSRVRTVASEGTSDIERTFEALNKMVLFTHLQDRYRNRTRLIADGDSTGRDAITRLQERYSDWPQDAFRTFDQPDFEFYYPEPFIEEVRTVLELPKAEKRTGKRALLQRILAWIEEDQVRARSAFEVSAATVIAELRSLEAVLGPAPESIEN